MRMTFKSALGGVAVTILFFLFNFHVSSCKSSGGTTDSSTITLVNSSFSSKFAFTNSSQTTVKCTSVGCASSDTSGNIGGTHYLLSGTLVTDSSGHFTLALVFTPKGDSANHQRIQVKSK